MGVDSVKAGGSAGHRLVLSCQGAECHPWAHSRGKSRVGMRGPPAWTSPVTPIVVECEEVEGMRGKACRDGLEIMRSVRHFLCFDHRFYKLHKCTT